MGCKPNKLQIQHNGELYNENTDVRKKFLTGVQVSKGADGIEGNIQIAFATTRVKKYEKVEAVSRDASSRQPEPKLEIQIAEPNELHEEEKEIEK